MSTPPDQFDTPWKEAVEHYFAEFMAFYFPDTHRQIGWAQGYAFLDLDPQARFEAKWRLIKTLLNRGWDKERIVGLLKVIDWMMYLPEHFKQQLWQNLQQLGRWKLQKYRFQMTVIADSIRNPWLRIHGCRMLKPRT